MQAWGFIWIMLILKIPLVMLLYTVWWAVKQAPEPVDGDQDGGSGDRNPPVPERPRWPRRRGPHGEPTVPAPPRTRTTARSHDRVGQ